LNQFSRKVGQTLTPNAPSSDTKEQNQSPTARNLPGTRQTSKTNAPSSKNSSSRSKTHQEVHQTFKYPPIDETLFDDDDPANEHSQDIPSQVPLASPDAITSSTRTDFTYSPIEDVSRTQSFRNLATQPTLSPDNNNSMPLWTTFTLFATFQHGHAKP
jgi:hypothetical protein